MKKKTIAFLAVIAITISFVAAAPQLVEKYYLEPVTLPNGEPWVKEIEVEYTPEEIEQQLAMEEQRFRVEKKAAESEYAELESKLSELQKTSIEEMTKQEYVDYIAIQDKMLDLFESYDMGGVADPYDEAMSSITSLLCAQELVDSLDKRISEGELSYEQCSDEILRATALVQIGNKALKKLKGNSDPNAVIDYIESEVDALNSGLPFELSDSILQNAVPYSEINDINTTFLPDADASVIRFHPMTGEKVLIITDHDNNEMWASFDDGATWQPEKLD